jgi:hypothetical protein
MTITVDHNPDDPTFISRHFSDPFARLANLRQRIKDQYFDITIGSQSSEKYLYELYYDLVFLKNLLVALGIYDEPGFKADLANNSGVDKVVEAIRSKLLTTE